MNSARKLAAEFLGTGFLLAIVVGSGIMGEKLANGNAAIALLANSVATGAGLVFLIYGFADISGAHFNPVVSLAAAFQRQLSPKYCLAYIAAQTAGAIAGVGIANSMFELPVFFVSAKVREGRAQLLSELVATFGLIAAIRLGVKFRPDLTGALIACYITSAYWFTSSTSFANPAVTVARSLSDTFAGIQPGNAPLFILAQLAGALAANLFFDWLLKGEKENA